mmetsp:Transcript_2396/g.4378  ORF Transcript_2396/g.4378 Transcript_2396/m.4378 type:complete len:147 (+) Transcript_2396:66-506(+)
MFKFVLFASLLVISAWGFDNSTVTGKDNCGGNCPGGCSSCPCGTKKSSQSASSWCSKYSGWKQSSCECIMNHESNANANAANENSNGSFDVGLWQINDMNWASCSGGKAPCSPSDNLNCAKKVFGWGGNTWSLWSTCGKCGVCNSN